VGKFKTIIRILILVCFLAPFITCHNNTTVESAAATSTDSVSINNNPTIKDSSKIIKDTLNNITPAPADTDQQSVSNKIMERILYPTDNSISGIGCIAGFPELPGILTAVIFLLSFFTLFPLQFLQKNKRRLYLNLIKLVSLILFIFYIFSFKDISILWGTWLLLLLIITELALEFKTVKQEASANNRH
jgi:hypothetical protein